MKLCSSTTMTEKEYSETLHFDRTVDQAILATKKGAYLLKCGRRGKPKFCPFRLSMDEKCLIWYSREEEKQLRLSSVVKIITGQRTGNFQRQLQPDREDQSFSLICSNTERTLDLICKDKAQANTWFVGLRAVIIKSRHPRTFIDSRSCTGVQSYVSSPAGFITRKHSLGLLEDSTDYSQARSLCASPSLSLHERCFSGGLSYSSESLCSVESDIRIPDSPFYEPNSIRSWVPNYARTELAKNASQRFVVPTCVSPRMENNEILKDVMIWGEKVLGGNLEGIKNNENCKQANALLPRLLETTVMLDVQNTSLGAKHIALVTKQGEVFCWGDGNSGKLGHSANIDVNYPKSVESLKDITIKSVSCSEYRTCAVSECGELYTWGENNYGNNLPRKISGVLDGVNVSIVACGEWHTAIVAVSGQLFTYGDGTFGVLGHGNIQSLSEPKEVESLKGLRVKSVACGPWHTAAIVETKVDCYRHYASDGKLFTWGDGDKGRLGHGDGGRKLLPACVSELASNDFIQVSCGWTSTIALTSSGTVYTMGSAVHGQLGNPQAKDKSITVVEGKLRGEIVKRISSGSYHVAVLTAGGHVYTWGRGESGQLGHGDSKDRNFPILVEALRDRMVENITCRSNLTAAICLHKAISLSDQFTCSGCKTGFGFTRKKHNCYNCGLLFCHGCSSKKAINASLTRNKTKPSRVCDSCYDHLHNVMDLGKLVKKGNLSPRLLATPKRISADEKQERREIEYPINEKNPDAKRFEVLEPSSLSNTRPPWGQVSSRGLVHFSQDALQIPFSVESRCLVTFSQGKRSKFFSLLDEERRLSESNKMLTEEVERLKAEAMTLEIKFEVNSRKLKECKQKAKDTWLVAKDETAKSKATKEVIKSLALKLQKFKELSAGRDAKCTIDSKKSRISPVTTYGSMVEHSIPVSIRDHSLNLPKERHVDSICNTPIVFSNMLKHARTHGKDRLLDNSVVDTRPELMPKGLEKEWVEQHEPGVYLTLTTLPGGQKGLKRVRFNRRRFSEKEAEKWWKENEATVYRINGIEGYTKTSQHEF